MNQAGIFGPSEPVKKAANSETQGYARSNPGMHRSTISLSIISPMKNPSGKDNCHICNCALSLMNKKLVCKGCGESMCYLHSSLLDKFNLERICDTCMHEVLVKQAEEEIAEIKQRYSSELSFSVLEREEKTRLINKAIGRMRKLKIEINDKFINYKKEEEKEKIKSEDLSKEISDLNDEIEHFEMLVEAQEKEARLETERFEMALEEYHVSYQRTFDKKIVAESVQNELCETKVKAQSYLSSQNTKNILCVNCNNVLAQQMPDLFQVIEFKPKSKKERLQDVSRQICTCNIY